MDPTKNWGGRVELDGQAGLEERARHLREREAEQAAGVRKFSAAIRGVVERSP